MSNEKKSPGLVKIMVAILAVMALVVIIGNASKEAPVITGSTYLYKASEAMEKGTHRKAYDYFELAIESQSLTEEEMLRAYNGRIKAAEAFGDLNLAASEVEALSEIDPNKEHAETYKIMASDFRERAEVLAEREAKEKAKEARKAQIEKGFSPWDGSHRSLEKIIKASMHNPDSYDHVETVYWDKTDHLIVRTKYRGSNMFGAIVTNWVRAKAGLDGNVIEVIEQGQ